MGNFETDFRECYKEYSLDDDERSILMFIIKNPGLTEHKVAKNMDDNGQCARETTRRKLRRLNDLKLIEDRKDKPNGFHKLYPSDKRQFNLIYGELTEIEEIINSLQVFNPGSLTKLEQPYKETISTILRFLMLLSILVKIPEYDIQTIHMYISKLTVKLNQQLYALPRGIHALKITRPKLEDIKKEIGSKVPNKENRKLTILLEKLIMKNAACERTMIYWLDKIAAKSNLS